MASRVSTGVLILLFVIKLTSEKPLLVVQKSCSNGSNTTDCQKTAIIRGQTSVGLPAVCYQRVDPGPCGRDLIRVYYDYRTARCKHFSFSGCGGNANRFVSIKNCYHICNPGYRTRVVLASQIGVKGQEEDKEETTTEKCGEREKKVVKLNVTSIEQIMVETK